MLGLLLAAVASQMALDVVFLVLGMARTRDEVLEPLAVEAVTSAVFAGFAVLTVAAASDDPWMLVVVAALSAFVGMSYRGYRRLAAQQRATEKLYAFVKELGPARRRAAGRAGGPRAGPRAAARRHLELAVRDRPARWAGACTVRLDGPPSAGSSA